MVKTAIFASGSGNGTGIVICPGGGYQILAYDKEGTDIANWLAGQGYTAFVLAYRVPDRRNEALQDLQRAVRMVRGCMPDLNVQKQSPWTISWKRV